MTVVAAAKYEIIQVVSRLHSGSVHLDRIGNPKRSDLPMMSDDDQKTSVQRMVLVPRPE